MTTKLRCRRFALRCHANDSGMDEAELRNGGPHAPRPISGAAQGKLHDDAPTRKFPESEQELLARAFLLRPVGEIFPSFFSDAFLLTVAPNFAALPCRIVSCPWLPVGDL